MNLYQKRIWLSRVVGCLSTENVNRIFIELVGTPERMDETLKQVTAYVEGILIQVGVESRRQGEL